LKIKILAVLRGATVLVREAVRIIMEALAVSIPMGMSMAQLQQAGFWEIGLVDLQLDPKGMV
jgi:hypothetical protein